MNKRQEAMFVILAMSLHTRLGGYLITSLAFLLVAFIFYLIGVFELDD